jgi:hypothetical protein
MNFGRITQIAGLLAVLVIGISPSVHAEGWVSPTGNVDGANWTGGNLARDGSTVTYASCAPPGTIPGWGGWETFSLASAIDSDRIRVFTDFGQGHVDQIQIDVSTDNVTWTTVFTGTTLNDAWDTKTYTKQQVQYARFRYHFSAGGWTYWLYELQIYQSPPVINPPTVSTTSATSVEQTSATVHGLLTDSGGEPCDCALESGTTTAYEFGSTPWLSDHGTGDTFGAVLIGLTNGTTYHYRAKARNSNTTSYGSDMTFTCQNPGTGWLSPTGHNDPDTKWDNETNVYDDETTTLAQSFHDINDAYGQWSHDLELTHSAILVDKIRFWAKKDAIMDTAQVDVYDGANWTNVFSGAYSDNQWVESATFTAQNVQKARIRFHLTNNGAGEYFELHEFDFHCGATQSITGTHDGVTKVSLSVNGTKVSSYTGPSPYTVSGTMGTGDSVLIYYDNDVAGTDGGIVTRATGSDMSGMNLSAGTLIIRSDGGTISNSNLASAYVTGDTDIPYTVAGNDITLSAGIQLYEPPGQTYAPGGNITVSGSVTFAGTFTCGSGTLSLTAGSGIQQLTTGGNVLNNLSMNAGGGGTTFLLQDNLNLNSSLTLTSGTLDTSTNNYDIYVRGSFVQSAGTTFYPRSGTLTMNGSTAGTLTARSMLNNLRVDKSGGTTVTMGAVLNVSGSVTLAQGAMDVSAGNFDVYVGRDFVQSSGTTFTPRSGTVTMNGSTAATLTSQSTLNNLRVDKSGASVTLGNALAASGTLTVAQGTLDVSTSNFGISVGGGWSNNGTFTGRSGAVAFTGSGTSTLSGATTFYDFTCTAAGKPLVFIVSATQTISHTFTLTGSVSNKIVLRSAVNGTKWAINFPNGTQSVNFVDVKDSNANNNTVLDTGGVNSGNNNANWIFPTDRFWIGGSGNWSDTSHWAASSGGGGGLSAPDNTQVAYFDSLSGGGTCTVDGVVNVQALQFSAGNNTTLSAVTYAITATGLNLASGAFNGGSGIVDINGNVVITGGNFTSTSGDLRVSGNLSQTGGVFAHNSGTVTMDGVVSGTITLLSATTLNNFLVDKTGGATATLGAVLNASGSVTVAQGALDV